MKGKKETTDAIEIIEMKIEKNKDNPLAWFERQQVDTLRWALGLEPKYTKEK